MYISTLCADQGLRIKLVKSKILGKVCDFAEIRNFHASLEKEYFRRILMNKIFVWIFIR